jgi:hypothetical protein
MTKKTHEAAKHKIAASSPAKANDLINMTHEIAAATGVQPSVQYEGIAVCGSHPETIALAPFDDPKWLIYACSPHNIEQRTLPRVDEWFEIHLPVTDRTRGYHYLRTLETYPLVWMRDKDALPWFKGGREYPEKLMKQRFGPFFFTSSIAFMLAKAIVDCERLNIRRIGLFGILQASKTEYQDQLPGTRYFIQRGSELGIEFVFPEQAKHIFESPPEIF